MEKFLEVLKERAGFFLIEMGHFKPFSTLVRYSGEVVDVESYSQFSTVEVMYELLLERVQQNLKDTDIRASAIVLTGKVDDYDVVVIEIFTNFQQKYQAVFPYTVNGETITFGIDLNKVYHTFNGW